MIDGRLPLDAPIEIRLRRIMSPDHPLWRAAIETIERWPPTVKRRGDQTWPAWFQYLDEIGTDALAASADDVEAFLGRYTSARARSTHRGTIRALYRAARDLGLRDDVPVPDLVPGRDPRAARRLDSDAIGKIEASLTKDARRATSALRAHRDRLLVALAYAFDCSSESLCRLTWGDVDEHGPRARLRIRRHAGTGWVDLPEPVLERIATFRLELARRGVDVVPEDALLAALGNRVEWNWTLPDRSLLARLTRTSASGAFQVILRRAAIDRSTWAARYFSHRWLLRSPADLAGTIHGPHLGEQKVTMRRTLFGGDPGTPYPQAVGS